MQMLGTVSLASEHVIIIENESATVTVVLDGKTLPAYREGEQCVLTLRPTTPAGEPGLP